MATLKNTKKYRNLSANPSVSLLIDSREAGCKDRHVQTKALTVTGTSQSGMGEQRRTALRRVLLARHPDMKVFFINPGAGIILQIFSGFEHILQGGGSQRVTAGKSFQEMMIIGNHCIHLGLLKHDLRNPDTVWIARFSPGKGTLMASVPG